MWREATHPGQMFGHLVIVKRGPRTKRRQEQWFLPPRLWQARLPG
jgi:hypothetical protein